MNEPDCLRVRFFTDDYALVDHLQRHYYLDPVSTTTHPGDTSTMLRGAEAPPGIALFIDAALFPELEDEGGAGYRKVVVRGGLRREDRLKMDAPPDVVAAALGAEPRPRSTSAVNVYGSPGRGGTGKSTMALEHARCASTEGRTILIELDVYGSLRSLVGALSSQDGIYELLRQPEIPWDKFDRYLFHRDELAVLLGPAERRDDAARVINPASVLHLLEALRRRYDNIFVDMVSSMAFGGTIWPKADHVVWVVDAEEASFYWAKALRPLLSDAGAQDRASLIINFSHNASEDATRAESVIGLPVLGTVSGDMACRDTQHKHGFIVDDRRSRVGDQIRNAWRELRSMAGRPTLAAVA